MKTKWALLVFTVSAIIGIGVVATLLFKPIPSPVARLEAEHEIYTILLTDPRFSDGQTNLILEFTTLGEFQENISENSVQFITEGLPTLKRETLVDFQEINKIAYPIKGFLPSLNNYSLVNPNVNRQIWWKSFSRIGFNSSATQALIIVEYFAACENGGCEYGTGNFVLFKKVNDKWTIEEYLQIWHLDRG